MPLERVVKALYTYDASDADELSFQEDNLLAVTPTDNAEWLMATKLESSEDSGLIPMNYVEEVILLCLIPP